VIDLETHSLLGIIGYWSAPFAAIILVEHFVFRKGYFSAYAIEQWDQPHQLPLGIAAVASFVGSIGIIVPSMSQAFYTGPIARTGTGDIGMLTGFFLAGLLYLILRTCEKKLSGKSRS
jgi:purine-cytosine permease-like protein